jgi:hypothetical protein
MMLFFSNVVDWVRKKLRIPLIEVDVTTINLNIVKVQSVMQNERLRREDAEKQLTVAIAILTNKINKIQSIVDQRGESTGSHQEK